VKNKNALDLTKSLYINIFAIVTDSVLQHLWDFISMSVIWHSFRNSWGWQQRYKEVTRSDTVTRFENNHETGQLKRHFFL
jgi:hypothetical protein